VEVDVAAMCLFLMVFAEAGPAHTDDCGRNTAISESDWSGPLLSENPT